MSVGLIAFSFIASICVLCGISFFLEDHYAHGKLWPWEKVKITMAHEAKVTADKQREKDEKEFIQRERKRVYEAIRKAAKRGSKEVELQLDHYKAGPAIAEELKTIGYDVRQDNGILHIWWNS